MNLIKRKMSKLSAFDIIIGAHSKSMFAMEGEKGPLKRERKQTGKGGESSLSVHSRCETNWWCI